MGTGKLSATKFIITKRIEQLPNALDVFCKPQAFSREEMAQAVDNILIPDTEALEQAVLRFLLKDFFVLMQACGLNNAQRALWGALAKVHQVNIIRDKVIDIKLEDSSTGTHVSVLLFDAEPSLKEILELGKKSTAKRVALMIFAPSFAEGVLSGLAAKMDSDPYASEISKGCALDLFSYQQQDHVYNFSLVMPAMPRPQTATIKL